MGRVDFTAFYRPYRQMHLAALIAAAVGTTGVAEETPANHPPRMAMLVRHPEIRKLRSIRWKPFIPAKPAAVSPLLHRPEFGFPHGVSQAIPLPEIPLDSLKPDETGREIMRGVFSPVSTEALPPISRATDNRVSLKEEMIDLEDLDIGKYGGMAAPAAGGEREMRGFLHIPTVWAESMNFRNSYSRGLGGGASICLAEAVNRYTGITARAGPQFFFSSDRLLRMPFIHFSSSAAFELTSAERRNFAQYLRNGGFAFLDNALPEYENNAAEASLRKMVRDALGSQARFEPLPVNHPLYHCWFDFDDGPPQGDGITMQTTSTTGGAWSPVYSYSMQKPVFYLEGIYLNGELVAVYSNKGYSQKWYKLPYSRNEITPQLKMGVNLIIYALTREGGMNHRNMEWFRNTAEE